jgi:hypothetical protein
MREYAAGIYFERATAITGQQAANNAARVNRDLAAGCVESVYHKHVQSVALAFQLKSGQLERGIEGGGDNALLE